MVPVALKCEEGLSRSEVLKYLTNALVFKGEMFQVSEITKYLVERMYYDRSRV